MRSWNDNSPEPRRAPGSFSRNPKFVMSGPRHCKRVGTTSHRRVVRSPEPQSRHGHVHSNSAETTRASAPPASRTAAHPAAGAGRQTERFPGVNRARRTTSRPPTSASTSQGMLHRILPRRLPATPTFCARRLALPIESRSVSSALRRKSGARASGRPRSPNIVSARSARIPWRSWHPARRCGCSGRCAGGIAAGA